MKTYLIPSLLPYILYIYIYICTGWAKSRYTVYTILYTVYLLLAHFVYIFIHRYRTVHLSGKYLVYTLHSTADWMCCWDRQVVVTGVLSYCQFVFSGMLPLNILACNKNHSSWFSSYHGWRACISQLFRRSLCHQNHHYIFYMGGWLTSKRDVKPFHLPIILLTFEVHHPSV